MIRSTFIMVYCFYLRICKSTSWLKTDFSVLFISSSIACICILIQIVNFCEISKEVKNIKHSLLVAVLRSCLLEECLSCLNGTELYIRSRLQYKYKTKSQPNPFRMIRDNRRVNIETNFYDDDDEYYTAANKPHEETFQTNLLNRDRGAIAMYNIMDTIRLHRVINAFHLLSSAGARRGRPGLRKYSSKDSLGTRGLRDRGQGRSQEPKIRYQYNEEEVQSQFLPIKIRNLVTATINNKRSQSVNAENRSQSRYLRQSRKRILESISKTLQEDSNQSTSAKNLGEAKKSGMIHGKKVLGQSMEMEEKSRSKQKTGEVDSNLHLKSRLQKLQRLMKNIRREKQKNLPTIVHQKRQVQQMPKKQRNHDQMRKFIEEIQSLRQQMHEIKVINEEILQHSRQRSARSSRIVSRSESQALPNPLHSLAYKNIKRSEVLGIGRGVEKPPSNSSDKGHHVVKNRKRIEEIAGRVDRDSRNRKESAPQKNLKVQRKQKNQHLQPKPKQKQPHTYKHKNQQIDIQYEATVNKHTIPRQSQTKTQKAPAPTPVRPKQYQQEPSQQSRTQQSYPQSQPQSQPQLQPQLQSQSQPQPQPQYQHKQEWQWQPNKPSSQTSQPKIQEQYKPFSQIVENNSNGVRNTSKYSSGAPIVQPAQPRVPLPPKPTSSQTRRLELEYKTSQWYREYGSPTYNMANFTPNSQPSITPSLPQQPQQTSSKSYLQSLQPIISQSPYSQPRNPSSKPTTNLNNPPYNLELLKLHQIKDAISNSNANSSRTSNLNSRTSSPRSVGGGYGYMGILGYGGSGRDGEFMGTGGYDSGYGSYQTRGTGLGGQSDSDYTNPNLLKQLNIGPFPKISSRTKDYQSPYTYNLEPTLNPSPTKASPSTKKQKGIDQYLKSLSNPSNSYTNPNTLSSSSPNYDKLSSFKTISDNPNQISSYTYSKGSSRITSMAKLEQEYQHIINDTPEDGVGGGGRAEGYGSYANYEPYQTGIYDYGASNGNGEQLMNMKKVSSLEDQVNSYFANNNGPGREQEGYEYYSSQSQWVSGAEGGVSSQFGSKTGYRDQEGQNGGNAYQRYMFDKYSRDY